MSKHFPILAFAALSLLAGGSASAASIAYDVVVDTSAVNSTAGFLDFQFNPGNVTTQLATLTITNFAGGTLGGVPSVSGNVSGTLPATLTFHNTAALNEYFQGFTYGPNFSFRVTLSGPAIDTPNGTSTAGSTFGLGLYDSGPSPILTNQTAGSGFAGEIDLNLDGTTTAVAFPGTKAPPVVSFDPVAAVPEPASLQFAAVAIAGLASLRAFRVRRHRRSRSNLTLGT